MISPEKLPTAVRGYRREETDELLKRVAWDYQQLLHERDGLAEQVRKLKQIRDDLETDKELLRAQRKELEGELVAKAAAPPPPPPRPEPDDVARALLGNAQRAARELRESTRAECEAILAKARKQATEIERQAHVNARTLAAEVERLERVRGELRDHLRQTLESMLREMQAQDGRPRPHLGDDLTKSLAQR